MNPLNNFMEICSKDHMWNIKSTRVVMTCTVTLNFYFSETLCVPLYVIRCHLSSNVAIKTQCKVLLDFSPSKDREKSHSK